MVRIPLNIIIIIKTIKIFEVKNIVYIDRNTLTLLFSFNITKCHQFLI